MKLSEGIEVERHAPLRTLPPHVDNAPNSVRCRLKGVDAARPSQPLTGRRGSRVARRGGRLPRSVAGRLVRVCQAVDIAVVHAERSSDQDDVVDLQVRDACGAGVVHQRCGDLAAPCWTAAAMRGAVRADQTGQRDRGTVHPGAGPAASGASAYGAPGVGRRPAATAEGLSTQPLRLRIILLHPRHRPGPRKGRCRGRDRTPATTPGDHRPAGRHRRRVHHGATAPVGVAGRALRPGPAALGAGWTTGPVSVRQCCYSVPARYAGRDCRSGCPLPRSRCSTSTTDHRSQVSRLKRLSEFNLDVVPTVAPGQLAADDRALSRVVGCDARLDLLLLDELGYSPAIASCATASADSAAAKRRSIEDNSGCPAVSGPDTPWPLG